MGRMCEQKGVREIGLVAFSQCSSLTDVVLPESLRVIGERAFDDCKKLSSIAIPERIGEIGDNAFRGCPLNRDTRAAIAAKDPYEWVEVNVTRYASWREHFMLGLDEYMDAAERVYRRVRKKK